MPATGAKNYRRRVGRRTIDVTTAYESELRAKAKRCPMPGCDVRMTDVPFLPNSKELDHIVPIGVGGTHTIGNVRIICRQCNLDRPDDGSDYTGPVTLWAEDPSVVLPVRRRAERCECGAVKVEGRCRRCAPLPPHRPARQDEGRRAARLRAEGLTWQAVADATGLGGTGSAYLCARKYGDPADIARWPVGWGTNRTSGAQGASVKTDIEF